MCCKSFTYKHTPWIVQKIYLKKKNKCNYSSQCWFEDSVVVLFSHLLYCFHWYCIVACLQCGGATKTTDFHSLYLTITFHARRHRHYHCCHRCCHPLSLLHRKTIHLCPNLIRSTWLRKNSFIFFFQQL